jgi:tripartite-type tricarboxylate transporter receptor subunit TctC
MAHADVGDFYRGKRVRVIIGADAASTYNPYARLTTKYMTKYLEGNPAFVAENMPGAGGKTAAAWLYNIAPKDGSVIATFSQGVPVDQALEQDTSKFDVAKFNWIGNSFKDTNITISWADAGFGTISDVISKGGMICGSTTSSGPQNTFPHMLNNLLAADIRVVSGYPGVGETALALQRGEVNCIHGTWANTQSTLGHLLKDRKINIIMQWAKERDPEISAYQGHDVPVISEFLKTDLDRRAVEFVQSSFLVGRPLVAPPDVPQDRVDALRRAFDATMKDSEFIAEAGAMKLAVSPSPVSGEELQRVVTEMTRVSPDVIKHLSEISRPKANGPKGKD